MNTSDICTPRLILKTITFAMMDAEISDLAELSQLINAQIPHEWPPEYREPHVFDFMKRQCAEFPHTLGWNRYLILRSDPQMLIGTVGGFLRTPYEAEIGYALVPSWQRRGLATEATQAFIAYLFATDNLDRVTGQTFPDLIQSVRVLEKCGFTLTEPRNEHGDEPNAVRYRLERARWQLLHTAPD
ncbi:MAG TPA: GNAT family protein [Acidobacteriaceae bacterium]|nr:GNAT family protein [Acidobacteriaceae bacterium]